MRLRLATLLLLATLLSCSRCARPTSTTPLQRIPAEATSIIHGPNLGTATADLGSLMGRLDQRARSPEAAGAREELAQRLGFDPFTQEGLAAAGIDGNGAYAGGLLPGGGWLWVLPVKDATLALATIERLALQTAGASRKREADEGSNKLVVFGKPFGSREVPVVAAAIVDKHLLAATGKECESRLRAALKGPVQPAATESNPSMVPIQFIVHPGRAADGTSVEKIAGGVVSKVTGTLKTGAQGLLLHLDLALTPAQKEKTLDSLFPPGADLPLLTFAEADALVLAKGQLRWKSATEIAETIDPSGVKTARQIAIKVGLGVDEGFMKQTDGHVAVAMYLLEPAELAALLRRGTNLRNEIVHLLPFTVALRPGTGETAESLANRLKDVFTLRGLVVAPAADDAKVLVASQPNGPTWLRYWFSAVDGHVIVGAGHEQRAKNAIARLRDKAAPVVTAEAALATPQSDVLLVRGAMAQRYLESLVQQDLGTGAEALMVRNLIQRVRGTVKNIEQLRVVLARQGDGLSLDVNLGLAPVAP